MAATKRTGRVPKRVVVTIVAAAFLCVACAQDEPPPTPPSLSDLFAAAERGDADAQYRLGDMYSDGVSAPEDYAEAVRWYLAAAEQGHAAAQYQVGRSSGSRVWDFETDDERQAFAQRWYLRAAEQGHAGAQYGLGFAKSLADDWPEAQRWYLRAAEQGHARAQFLLGDAYMLGNEYMDGGFHAEAFRWYLRAAEQGHAEARYRLAFLYRRGDGVPRDGWKAWLLYHSLAEESEEFRAVALFQQGLMNYHGEHNVSMNKYAAAERFHRAAEAGHAEAAYRLGLMLYNGEMHYHTYGDNEHTYRHNGEVVYDTGDDPANKAQARRWFRRAATAGPRAWITYHDSQRSQELFRAPSLISVEAQYRLGLMSYRGEGGSRSPALAASWYCAAADNGHSEAQASLGALYSSGLGVPEDLVRAYFWISGSGVENAQDAMDSLARRMTVQQLAEAQEGSWSSLADCETFGQARPPRAGRPGRFAPLWTGR